MTCEEWSRAQDQAYLEAMAAGCYPCSDAPYPPDLARIEQLEIVLRAALSYIQERHSACEDRRTDDVIAAVRAALRKDRD